MKSYGMMLIMTCVGACIHIMLTPSTVEADALGGFVDANTFVLKDGCFVLFRAFSNGKVEKYDCKAPKWVAVGEARNPDSPTGRLVGFEAHLINVYDDISNNDQYVLFRWFDDGTIQKHDSGSSWQTLK